MGLRDVFGFARSVRESAADIERGELEDQERQRLEQLRERFPDLIPQLAEGGRAAREAAAGFSGQLAGTRQELRDAALTAIPKERKAGDQPMSLEQVKQRFPELNKAQQLSIEGLTISQGTQRANTFRLSTEAARRLEESKRKTALLKEGEERRAKGQVLGQFKDIKKDIDVIEKDFRATRKAFKQAKSALEQGKVASDAVVLNFVARTIGGEKGPLTDSDIARVIAPAIGASTERVLNFVQNKDESVLTEAQRQTFRELIAKAEKNVDETRQKDLSESLIRSSNLSTLLEGGKVDPRLKKFSESLGFEASVDDEGGLVLKARGETQKRTIEGVQTENFQFLERVPDPALRERLRQEALKRDVDAEAFEQRLIQRGFISAE